MAVRARRVSFGGARGALAVLIGLTFVQACGASETSGGSGEVLPEVLADAADDEPGPSASPARNVLVIILDDVGAVSMGAYVDYWAGKPKATGGTWEPERTAQTPTVDGICAAGLRFTEAWSHPTCSPTRAAILTGRQPFRTGVGEPCGKGSNEILPDEPTLPRVIAEQLPDYGLGSVGKWHLGTGDDKGGDEAPNTMGWQYFAGILSGGADYFTWERTVNGQTDEAEGYITSQITDDAIAFLAGLEGEQPWLLWVAYTAAHTPIHLPPAELHSYDELPEELDETRTLDYFEAMVEAMDTEIARLLASLPDDDGDGLPDDTLLILLGDNGGLNSSSTTTLPAPFDKARAKGSVYEHGVRVALCIAGAGVTEPSRDVEALVSVVDLYDTILEAVGLDPAAVLETPVLRDSVTLTPYLELQNHSAERAWVMTEQFASDLDDLYSHGFAIKDKAYKFVRTGQEPTGDELPYIDECFGADNVTDRRKFELYAAGDAEAAGRCDGLRDLALGLLCSISDSPFAAWCP